LAARRGHRSSVRRLRFIARPSRQIARFTFRYSLESARLLLTRSAIIKRTCNRSLFRT